jgi:hypothetical protein
MEDRYYLVAAPIVMTLVLAGLFLLMAWPLWPVLIYFGACLPLIAIILASRNNFTRTQKDQILKKANFDHLLGLPPQYMTKLKSREEKKSDNSQVA